MFRRMFGFGRPVSNVSMVLAELSSVEKDLMLRKVLWDSLGEWSILHNRWNDILFSSLDVGKLQREVTRFVQTVYLLEKGMLILIIHSW